MENYEMENSQVLYRQSNKPDKVDNQSSFLDRNIESSSSLRLSNHFLDHACPFYHGGFRQR